MKSKQEYLKLISERGSRYGSDGGLLDLLEWCKKTGLYQVTAEEAQRYWEDPFAPYAPAPGEPDENDAKE